MLRRFVKALTQRVQPAIDRLTTHPAVLRYVPALRTPMCGISIAAPPRAGLAWGCSAGSFRVRCKSQARSPDASRSAAHA